MCSSALRAYELTYQRVLRTYVLTCQRALRANVPCVLTRPRATCLACLRAHMQRVLRAHVPPALRG